MLHYRNFAIQEFRCELQIWKPSGEIESLKTIANLL